MLLLFVLLYSSVAYSLDFFQEKPSLELRSINSPHYEIIYPTELEKKSKRIFTLLENYREDVSKDYYVIPRKIPLVLHNDSAISNGFVTLGPYRSEWYLTPSLDRGLSTMNFDEALAVHEYRHVAQFEKMRGGANKYFYYLLGDTGLNFGMVLSAPSWYYEGDAVVTETELTKSGRGRNALFHIPLLALRDEKKEIDYETLFFENYNYKLPNHYEYGYQFIKYLKEKYGSEKLNDLITESIRDSYWPFTFYNSFPYVFQRDFISFHNEVIASLPSNDGPKDSETTTLYSPKKENGFTAIKDLKLIDQNYYFIKKDFNSINALYRLKNGELEKLIELNIEPSNRGAYSDKKYLYTETFTDPRYLHRSFMKLFELDLLTLKRKHILTKNYIYHQAYSLDEKTIFTIEKELDGNLSIMHRNFKGEEIKKYSFSDITPSFLTPVDSENVLFISQTQDGRKAISNLNLETSEIRNLTPLSYNSLSDLKFCHGLIFYERDHDGRIEIINLKDGKEFILTRSRYGARDATCDEENLYYLDYTFYGNSIVKKPLSLVSEFSTFEDSPNTIENQHEVHEERYNQLSNLFNFHSWKLIPLPGSVDLGATSTNVLNTLKLDINYSYSHYERANSIASTLHFQKYYPIFSFEALHRERNIFEDKEHLVRSDHFEETIFKTYLTIPHMTHFSVYNQLFSVQLGGNNLITTKRKNTPKTETSSSNLMGALFNLNYSLTKIKAKRDINPNFGLDLALSYSNAYNSEKKLEEGFQKIASANFYLKQFVLHSSYEEQLSYSSYRFPTLIKKVRGSEFQFAPKLHVTSVDYFFNVSYPDFSLSKYYYLPRIYSSIFYDYGDSTSEKISSYGLDTYFESRFIRLLPLTFGIRYAHVNEKNEDVMEFFLKSEYLF